MRRSILVPLATIAAAISACRDMPSEPTTTSPGLRVDAPDERLSVCHRAPGAGSVLAIAPAALAAHLGHGDYAAGLVVSREIGSRDDGVHFARITDALAAARATRLARGETSVAACRITITVGPGLFLGSAQASADPSLERFPLVVDVPDVTLAGSFRMQLDADGRAAGVGDGPATTILAARPGLRTPSIPRVAQSFLAEPMLIVTDAPDGAGGAGAVIERFVFQSGNEAAGALPGGNVVYAMRARDLVIRGNRVETGFSEPITLRSSTARVVQNHVSGIRDRCTLCLSGPGEFEVTGNRLIGGGIDGIFITAATDLRAPPAVRPQVLGETVEVTATVSNNDVHGFQHKPTGAGLRIGALGANTSGLVASAHVEAVGNRFVGSTFNVMVEAAFPVEGMLRHGDVQLTLRGNTISGGCQSDLLVSFTRHTAGLEVTSGGILQTGAYLQHSGFTLALGGDVAWSDAWYAHPDGFGNSLVVNGQVVPHGKRVAYDATRECLE